MPLVNRREAISISSAALAGALISGNAGGHGNVTEQDPSLPWYRRTLRWGQAILNERDPDRIDIAWWRDYWRRTSVQGVTISAGGIAAFYPSKFPLHRRAEFLNGRDLYGELVQAAHEDGLVVLARMSSNCAGEEFFRAHPDWFARQQSGEPYRAAHYYVTCINGPYYDEYMPSILEEIIERTHPEGFFDAFWVGLPRDSICYCENCARKFRDKTGQVLPKRKDWDNAAYRKWIEWSYERRTEVCVFHNRVTKSAGGSHCLWLPDIWGSSTNQRELLYDIREIGKRSEIVVVDYEARPDDIGFQKNGDHGKLVHQVVGWNKVIIGTWAQNLKIEMSAETSSKLRAFTSQNPAASDPAALVRLFPVIGSMGLELASKPEPEVRMWMIEGIAGGFAPWWLMAGAYQEDQRIYQNPERVFQWHKEHQQYLTNRRPVATVGIVWSRRNADYYGRDDVGDLVDAPYHGFMQALIRGRIPYLPLHASDIDQQAGDLAVLILPNVGALSDAECNSIRQFALRGGAVIASGATSLYDEWGDARSDFALADLFGAHAPSGDFGRKPPQPVPSYLRLAPERRGKAWAPKLPDDSASEERHPVLRGFDETDIIPFGSALENLRIDPGVIVPLTFVPLQMTSMETFWLPQPKTDIAGLVLNSSGNARVAYLPADIDRLYAHNNFPDHGNLLANIVRWAAGDRIGFELQGQGLIDCHVYHQPGRVIVHLVNLTNQGTWRSMVDELLPVGPLKLRMKLPQDVRGRVIECLVSRAKPAMAVRQNWASLEVGLILDHEVLVIS